MVNYGRKWHQHNIGIRKQNPNEAHTSKDDRDIAQRGNHMEDEYNFITHTMCNVVNSVNARHGGMADMVKIRQTSLNLHILKYFTEKEICQLALGLFM